MTPGDRVKLNEAGLRWLTTNRQSKVLKDWRTAVGTLLRIGRDRQSVRVIWDGNKHPSDAVPLKFLCVADA
jgi:hypothetical protein